ncbi:hypothetical protein CONLIGDRAFT_418582 [Coniochaeta ligniaria NRRL 30616]|uniref:Uncharacterized protein n=1 Tax=Coniochaeta ligniaria NRRL 30616 TaxID=1408157 RepID=A0A1J7IIL4_9PEZI|nr:hypothetical protein CONLIGDRAFT_418582 [Coniochaeta ligniaria NRRL 30616]
MSSSLRLFFVSSSLHHFFVFISSSPLHLLLSTNGHRLVYFYGHLHSYEVKHHTHVRRCSRPRTDASSSSPNSLSYNRSPMRPDRKFPDACAFHKKYPCDLRLNARQFTGGIDDEVVEGPSYGLQWKSG